VIIHVTDNMDRVKAIKSCESDLDSPSDHTDDDDEGNQEEEDNDEEKDHEEEEEDEDDEDSPKEEEEEDVQEGRDQDFDEESEDKKESNPRMYLQVYLMKKKLMGKNRRKKTKVLNQNQNYSLIKLARLKKQILVSF
jgi:hypothetical protein